MKTLISLFVLLGSVTFVFAQEKITPVKQEIIYSRFNVGGNNMVVKNADGVNSTIACTSTTVTLTDPDESSYLLLYNRKISTLINPDGTSTVVQHSRNSSVLINEDGSRYVVYHDRRYSTLMSAESTLTIHHTYESASCRWRNNVTDVLIHKRWLDKKATEAEVNNPSKKSKKMKKRRKRV